MVVQQLANDMKPQRGAYLSYYREARELMARLPDECLVWVSRGENIEADALSRQPLKSFFR